MIEESPARGSWRESSSTPQRHTSTRYVSICLVGGTSPVPIDLSFSLLCRSVALSSLFTLGKASLLKRRYPASFRRSAMPRELPNAILAADRTWPSFPPVFLIVRQLRDDDDKEGLGGLTAPRSSVIRLEDNTKGLVKGDRVLAVFPDTTSFYLGTVHRVRLYRDPDWCRLYDEIYIDDVVPLCCCFPGVWKATNNFPPLGIFSPALSS